LRSFVQQKTMLAIVSVFLTIKCCSHLFFQKACLPVFQFSTFGRPFSLLSALQLRNALKHRLVLECPQPAMDRTAAVRRRGLRTPQRILVRLSRLLARTISAARQCQLRETALHDEHHPAPVSVGLVRTLPAPLHLGRHQDNCVWTT
jgi:hypothetical protein